MLESKFKETTKYKTFGKSTVVPARASNDVICTVKQKHDVNNYVNEIFAGLMWLG